MPHPEEDPIFDYGNGTKTSVTASATVLTPATDCRYVRVIADATVVVNASGSAAVDDGSGVMLPAYVAEIIPVSGGVPVKALSLAGTATVRCTPMKVR
jgi:hypothetical protein